MSKFPYRVIQSVADLPDAFIGSRTVYCDVETVSGNARRPGSKPSRGDRIAGIGLTVDDNPEAVYIPLRHGDSDTLFSANMKNIAERDNVVRWLDDLLRGCEQWVNHNVKFDAHFLAADGVDILGAGCKLVDTVTLAKLVDMQRRVYTGGYGLKPLAKAWLGHDPDERDEVKAELKRMRTEDYGAVSIEVMAPYACADVQLNRLLWDRIRSMRYSGDESVWDMEIALTKVLWKMEARGLLVDTDAMQGERDTSQGRIAEILHEIETSEFRHVDPASTSSLKRFLLDDLGMPIVQRTEKDQPSFGSLALKEYQEHPRVQQTPGLVRFLELVEEYREETQFLGLYADGWDEHIGDSGLLHCNYQQTVSTGRMSCREPNMQQLNKRAKRLIVPRPGNAFLSRDYSQIEYRIICSVCREQEALDAYNANPDTDFHTFVAELCGIDRRPAKNVNFGISFGMGEPGLIRQLTQLIGGEGAAMKAHEILSQYHGKFPNIKRTFDYAKKVARTRANWQDGKFGWIKTLSGRRRALKYYRWRDDHQWRRDHIDETRKAFNSVVQGTAADIAKAQAVLLDAALEECGDPIWLAAIVHDEFLLEGSDDAVRDPDIQRLVEQKMTDINLDLGLPLYVDGGESEVSWADAA